MIVRRRKTGKKRTVPIACYPYRDSVAVSASNSGLESHPAWYLNMQANPRVTVQLGKETFEALAEKVPAINVSLADLENPTVFKNLTPEENALRSAVWTEVKAS